MDDRRNDVRALSSLFGLVVVALVAPVLGPVPGAWAAKDDLTLVSRRSDNVGGADADDDAVAPSLSGDGRFVVFESTADNLSSVDNNDLSNIFVRDTWMNTTSLASLASSDGSGNNAANKDSHDPAISADGRYVVFQSLSTNLFDQAYGWNIFLRDTVAETTTLVSRQSATSGGMPGSGQSSYPAVSADGRFVVFVSEAANLSSADNDANADTFVRDTLTSTTKLVSRASGAAGAGATDDSWGRSSISGDGRYVAFASDADNLSTQDDNRVTNVFVRDLQANTTALVSSASTTAGGAGGDASSYAPSISADGRYVAFTSSAKNLSSEDIDAYTDVFVRDLQTSTTALASRASLADGGAGADAWSYNPSISADGRYVSFESGADNLSAADDNAYENVFVRDTQSSTTTLVSRQAGATGAAAHGDSYNPSISADGRSVAFTSTSANLSPLDADGTQDIFLRDVLGGGAPPPEPTRLALVATSPRHGRLGRPLKLTVSCDAPCSVLVTATAVVKRHGRKRSVAFPSETAAIAAGETVAMRLKPTAKGKRRLVSASRATAWVTVTARDGAGNATSTSVTVKLRSRRR